MIFVGLVQGNLNLCVWWVDVLRRTFCVLQLGFCWACVCLRDFFLLQTPQELAGVYICSSINGVNASLRPTGRRDTRLFMGVE